MRGKDHRVDGMHFKRREMEKRERKSGRDRKRGREIKREIESNIDSERERD